MMPTKKLTMSSLSVKSFVTSVGQPNGSGVRGGLGSGAGCIPVTNPSPGCNAPTGEICEQYSLNGGIFCVESQTCPPS
jgi:hypothetical protein